jgi:hypothetical protein
MELIQNLLTAAKEYDRLASEAAAQALVEHVRSTGETLDLRRLRTALTTLRNNRWFDLLLSTADGILQAGDERPFVKRLYAQALIDSGVISAAILFLQTMIADADDAFERTDARGLLGRAYKQAYVNSEHLTRQRGKALLENAITAYYEPYTEDPKNYYHGINAVACLARAQRDGIQLSDSFPDWRDLARTIRSDIEAADERMSWDYGTAIEASLALGDVQSAVKWINEYMPHPDTSAFAIAGTLRQLTEVWGLSPDDPDGGTLVHALQAALLKKEGGESIELSRQSKNVAAEGLEAILGEDQYRTLEWYERGLTRARAVARIRGEASNSLGTGFLVNASDLDPKVKGQLLITSHHVIPGLIPDYEHAVVTFEALDGGAKKYAIAEMLWTSPVNELDTTVLRLKEPVAGVELYPICQPPLPPIEEKPHLYVIGHPTGGTMQFSISDNLMIDHEDPKVHYRTPTFAGSSGSPVFDDDWKLLALHHMGSINLMPRLQGGGLYSANEGLYFPTIVGRFRERRMMPDYASRYSGDQPS